jgi:kynurenine formamidase
MDVEVHADTLIEVDSLPVAVTTQTDLLLLRTGFERHRHDPSYWQSNPGISPDVALWLRRFHPHVRAVGIDCISITSRAHRNLGRESHLAFLDPTGRGEPIVLVEDMSLAVNASILNPIIILPLRVLNSDGVPCTVIGYT